MKNPKKISVELTENEIKLIKNALCFVYDKKMELISNKRAILSDEEREVIVKKANEYFDVQDAFDEK